jgi:predicted phage terminase large subunit-like protein
MVDPSRLRLQQALLRTDFSAFYAKSFVTLKPGIDFQDQWLHQHMAWALERVRRGDERRLVINVAPRSGKSLLTSVAWPMFVLGHDPSCEILAISHTDSLARDFSLMRRAIGQQPWYRQLFPELRFKRTRNMDLETTAGGRIFASGVSGAVLGKGADLIILDDPQQGSAATSEAERRRFNEFYDNTLIGRLNNKSEGAIVLAAQRLHQDDATAHLAESDDFAVIRLPAIATEAGRFQLSHVPGDVYRRRAGEVLDPVREPMEVLEQIRRVQGHMYFQAQYQQEPVPAGGNLIQRAWLRYYDQAPSPLDRRIVSWDTASTLGEASDYSVGTVWGAKGLDFYLLDIVRDRLRATDLRRHIVTLHERWEADITLIEDTELGRAITHELHDSRTLRPILWKPIGSKQARMEAQAARFETGQVHFPRHHPALGEYEGEILAFPSGRHDDQVDSTSQALHYLTRNAAIHLPRPAEARRPQSRPRPPGSPQRRR